MAYHGFDGTWNVAKDRGEYGRHTNVVEFYKRYDGPKFLYAGVGTRHGWIGKMVGGAFGVGGHERIKEAIANVLKHPDEPVDIGGFSRGFGLAMTFANKLSKMGIPIRFIGGYDLVGSFGIPLDFCGIPFQRINLGYCFAKPKSVENCFHAVAIDENRAAFTPTHIDGAYEVCFRGAHSDVGGGNNNPALSNIPLRWMLHHAARCGLPVVGDPVDLPIDPRTKVKQIQSLHVRRRELKSSYRVHHTALAGLAPLLVEWAPEPDPNVPIVGTTLSRVRSIPAETTQPSPAAADSRPS